MNAIFKNYKSILLHNFLYSDKLLLLSCRWNYNAELCKLSNEQLCQDILSNGVGLFHHARKAQNLRLFKHAEPIIIPIYYAFKHYDLTTDFKLFFLDPLIEGLNTFKYYIACSNNFKNLINFIL